MKDVTLDGETLDLSVLPERDVEFLRALARRASEDHEDYASLASSVFGPCAHPLKGNMRVTREVHGTLLFRAAEDIVDRAAIRLGLLAHDGSAS